MNTHKPLTEQPIPRLVKSQLDLFTENSIHSEELLVFDVDAASKQLINKEGVRVLAADFGGDKGVVRLFEVNDGSPQIIEGYSDDIQGNDGFGYTDTIERAAAFAEEQGISFGISWGGPLVGSRLEYHPKARIFMAEMEEKYGSDIKKVSPSITACVNDGPAGLIQGAVEAYRRYGSNTALFPINGGGLGIAALVGGKVYSTESGHIEGIADLNTYGQTTACGVFNATYTCLEQLGANKAGIESQWQNKTGEYMRARDIEDRYKEGDAFAAELYDHSAWVVSHMIAGTAKVYNIDLTSPQATIIGHGGAFKFPGYAERIQQILSEHAAGPVQFIATKDYTPQNSNACLDGAAIAALTSS
jgi:ROK family